LPPLARAFSGADDNRDGKLDRDEFVKTQAIYDRVRAKAYIDDSMIGNQLSNRYADRRW